MFSVRPSDEIIAQYRAVIASAAPKGGGEPAADGSAAAIQTWIDTVLLPAVQTKLFVSPAIPIKVIFRGKLYLWETRRIIAAVNSVFDRIKMRADIGSESTQFFISLIA